jgi:hypothetical protein
MCMVVEEEEQVVELLDEGPTDSLLERVSPKRVTIQVDVGANSVDGSSVVVVSPKTRLSKGSQSRLKVTHSDDFVLDRILDERGQAHQSADSSAIQNSISVNSSRRRSRQKRKALYVSKNPLLGDVHMLSTKGEVSHLAVLDPDFADDCVVSELDVCELEDEVQFEIPSHLVAMGAAEFDQQLYTNSADIATLMGLSDTTVDYIVNYGAFNGHLDDYRCESFVGIKKRFRHDGASFLKVVREILDSGASHSMSGDARRIKAKEAVDIAIRGFNDSRAVADSKGLNSDGVMELYIPSMPEDLVLLCLHDYAKKGCVYLTEFGGKVLHLSRAQQDSLERFLSSFPAVLNLEVQNGVYVVDRSTEDNYEPHRAAALAEEAFWAGICNRAGLYFNGRVNYNQVSDHILGMLMSGLSFGAIRSAVKHQSIGGVHPSITLESLARYEREHGRSPDVVQIALAHQIGNQKAFDKQKEPLTRVGQRIELDAFAWDANDRATRESKKQARQSLSKAEREQEELLDNDEYGVYSERKRVDKLRERGGADHCEIFMDCYSGKVFGKLRKPGSKALDGVKECIAILQALGVKIEKFAADSGYLSDSQYRTFTSDVVAHLLECEIEIERAEAYNHSIGTAYIENMVKLIKQLMRQAYRYVEMNVNIKKLAFKELDILKLWGEIFHWAINVINLYPSPRVEGMTREEAFSGVRPNIQQTRLLPIFATVLVWQGVPKRRRRIDGKVKDKEPQYRDYYDKASYVYGLYVGFEVTTPGNIRVAIKTDKGIRVISTSKYKGVSEGGSIDISADVQRAADRMILDQVKVQSPVDGSQEADESEEAEQYVTDEEAVIDGAVRTTSTNLIIRNKIDEFDDRGDSRKSRPVDFLDSVSEDCLSEGTGIDEEAMKEQRGRELNIRNKLVYHDRSEYNPVNHPSRDERAAMRRKSSDPMQGLYTAIQREGWVLHARVQNEVEHTAMVANRDFVKSMEDKVDERNFTSMLHMSEASERRRDIAEAMFSFDQEMGSGYFTDWTNFCVYESYFADLAEECFVKLGEAPVGYKYDEVIDGYRAVTENTPRNFGEALRHPVWGESARKELNDLLEKAMIRIPADIALEGIAKGSDCLTLFPVYESKIRNGQQLYKVRLVADGRRHSTAGPTYSSTPSREEFLMFIDMIARLEWEWCHVDENRAFLNADRQDQIPLYARLKGEKDWFQIIRALYGLKTSTRDHSIAAAIRLEKLGFVRRGMCTNIFEKFWVDDEGKSYHVIVYQYVDDYFFAGNCREAVERCVTGFRNVVGTSEPLYDPEKGLGMEFVRDRSKRTISIRMTATIQRMYDEFVTEANKSKKVDLPIPKGKYIVEKSDFDQMELDGDPDGKKVDSEGRSLYMKQVGAILWVSGVRFDINLATVYLTWFTHEPRGHHLNLSERVIRYLGQTKDEPLVLGGFEPAQIRTLSDCSLGTGPKGRSIVAYGTRMSMSSGFIATKVKATQYMALSSFEGEINGYFESFKTSARYANIAKEMSYPVDPVRVIIGDNEKAIQFIRGEAEGKGIRHALRRFSYMREEYAKGTIDLQWLSGKTLIVDAMTKVVDVESFERFRNDVLGHTLLTVDGISR